MNEIHGFGPLQPLRPGTPVRHQAPLAPPEATTPEARDQVNLRIDLPAPPALSGPHAPVVQLPTAPLPDLPTATRVQAPSPREVQDFDGFLVTQVAVPDEPLASPYTRWGDWALGYPYALGLMVASALGPMWYFRKRGWLK